MRTQVLAALAFAALILGVIVAIAPKTTVIANEMTGEIYGIDVLAITQNAKDLPNQQFAAH